MPSRRSPSGREVAPAFRASDRSPGLGRDANKIQRCSNDISPRRDRHPLPTRDIETLVDWSVRQLRELDEDEKASDESWLDADDDVLLLRLHQLIRGPLLSSSGRPLEYEHLMVDEAQDLAPLELALLLEVTSERRRSPSPEIRRNGLTSTAVSRAGMFSMTISVWIHSPFHH